ncbi:MAG TPA: copper chaperone PCu(A)C, partial [Mycobacteriales bacterium]|nr:copper chaperone PCu(A)C [Mycobacteriales bacterium]
AAPGGGVVAGSIRVFGAYVREPASPDVAAAYLSIANDGTKPDTLLSVTSGAASSAAVHDVPGQTPTQTPGSGAGSAGADAGTDEMTATGPLTIPGGSTVTLAPTRGHVMLEGLAGLLRPGDRVSLLLTFRRAGQVLVSAPVVPIASPAPTPGGG